jgi:REP element-mobilizing transposase RayT
MFIYCSYLPVVKIDIQGYTMDSKDKEIIDLKWQVDHLHKIIQSMQMASNAQNMLNTALIESEQRCVRIMKESSDEYKEALIKFQKFEKQITETNKKIKTQLAKTE